MKKEYFQLIVDHQVWGECEVSVEQDEAGHFTWGFSDPEVEEKELQERHAEHITNQVRNQLDELKVEADMSAELERQADDYFVDLPW